MRIVCHRRSSEEVWVWNMTGFMSDGHSQKTNEKNKVVYWDQLSWSLTYWASSSLLVSQDHDEQLTCWPDAHQPMEFSHSCTVHLPLSELLKGAVSIMLETPGLWSVVHVRSTLKVDHPQQPDYYGWKDWRLWFWFYLKPVSCHSNFLIWK